MTDSSLIGKDIGQYQIVEQIGQGGMATVYRAYQPSINRYVAIKILPSQYAQDPNFVKRFKQEATAIAALEHPHILPVYDFGTQDGLTYMVMRYVKGGTLSNLMGKPMAPERIVHLISSVARALDYAHKQGVVHRDIKPSNILIDKNGEPLLTDFGIAKLIEGSGATQLTGSGTVLGTPAYMSPEQAKGQPVDGRSDIYSLGVVLYELLTGQQPYQAETPLAVVLKHVSEPLPLPRTVNPGVPAPLERVVIKAMAKEPDQRYQSLAEMDQALQAALKEIESGASTVNVPATPAGSTRQFTGAVPAPKKSSMVGPLLIGGGVVVALLCLIGGGLALFGLMAAPEQARVTPTAVNRTPVSIGIEKTATPTPTSASSPADSAVSTGTPTPEATSPVEAVEAELTAAAATLEVELTAAAATLESSLDVATGEGDILLTDNFDSNRNQWHTGEEDDEYGHTEYRLTNGRYRITQEATQGVFAWSSIKSDFDNFVLSVEATPVEHTAPFAYGVTLRENSDGDLYTFEVDTDGYFTVNLRRGGEWKTLTDWSRSSAIKTDGPNQLMIKAIGSSFTFLVNGQEVATVEDDTLQSGAIGLALDVFNEGDKATIDFDDLVVRQLSSAEQALVGDSGDASSRIIFEDTFDSDANGWATGQFEDEYSQNEITIQDGRYTLSVVSKPDKFPYVEKVLPNRQFGDFVLTIEATPRDSETHYSYGVAFREDGDGNVYVFEIGNDGLYAVLLYDQEWKKLKDWSSSPAIKAGQTNSLIVSAIGDALTFYVNDVQLTSLQDSTLAEGKIGLVVDMAEGDKSATVDFDNLIINKP